MRTLRTVVLLLLAGAACLCGAWGLAQERRGEKKMKSPQRPAANKERAAPPEVRPAEKARTPARGEDDAARQAVAASAAEFAEAFNQHDAAKVAAGFTADAEMQTADGAMLRGREAIQRHFAEGFAALPESKIEITVESVRTLTPDAVLEEGVILSTPAPGEPLVRHRYVALHVRQEGRWLIARSRDDSAEADLRPPSERLQELDWMTGEWIDESEATLVETSCRWADSRNYLLMEFTMRLPGRAASGSTRIGWDPLARQFRSWTFDSSGGFSEARWSREGDGWLLKSSGVSPDGSVTSSTTVLRPVDANTLEWTTRDRIEDGVLIATEGTVLVKRRPPPPAD